MKTLKKHSTLILTLVVILTLFTSISGQAITSAKAKVLKIGFIIPLSGFGAYWGLPVKNGAELAVKELRKQGFNFNLIFENSEGNPTKAVTAAQKLISIDKVDALYVEFTAPAQAVAPVAASAKKVMYYNSFDEEPLTKNPYALKTFFHTREVCYDIANYAFENNVTKIGYIGPKIPIVPQCLEELRAKYRDNLFVETLPTPKDSDYRSALLKLKSLGTQFLVSLAYEDNYLNIQKQKFEQQFTAPLFCTAAECYSDKNRSNLPKDAAESNIVFDLKINPKFSKKYKTIYSQASLTDIKAAAFAYDAIYYLARGFSQCKSKNPSCVVKAVVKDKKYGSQIKSKGFGQDRKLQINTYYYKIEKGQLKPIGL